MEGCPESLGAMWEYWYIEHGLLPLNLASNNLATYFLYILTVSLTSIPLAEVGEACYML